VVVPRTPRTPIDGVLVDRQVEELPDDKVV